VSSEPLVREVGVPVRGVCWARLHPGRTADGKASLLASMCQSNGGAFVLDIDLESGHCRKFPVRDGVNSTFSPASWRSLLSGILYIASGWDAHLHRFDANHPERGLEDLGRIDPDPENSSPFALTETPDGAVWIGSYAGARLSRYEPSTGRFTAFGRMDEVDNYLYPLGGDDGSLAAVVKFSRPHLIVIDPATGEHREAGPCVTDPTDKAQHLRFFKGTDRRLYLDTHAGKFRVDGMSVTPVQEVPEPLPGIHATYKHAYQAPAVMPGGWTAHFLDDNENGTGIPREVLLVNSDPLVPSRRLTLDWVGDGSNVYAMDIGPGGDLYGSSYMPNHLFRAKPDGSELTDLGKHTLAMGVAYALATVGDKVYLGSYPEARLSVYDRTRPVRFGTGPGDNPRDLGRLDGVSFRPNAVIPTPDGRIWFGSSPDYGLYDGTIAWYNPANGERKSHRTVVAGLSPACMLYLPGLDRLLVGLSIEAGTGMRVKSDHGAFALWDPGRDQLEWSGDLGIGDLSDVVSLCPAGGGLVLALVGRGDHVLLAGGAEVRPRLVLLDPARREAVASAWLPEDFGPVSWHGYFSLRVGPGGVVYGASGYCIFRVRPGTCEVERIWQKVFRKKRESVVWLNSAHPDVIDVVGPIIGDQFYFATGWRLRALTLPPS
jgi:hypothetical protein